MSNAVIENYQEKDIIFAQGDTRHHLYKIMSGTIGLYLNYGRADEHLVGVTSAPRYIGMMNAFADQPSTYTAVALSKVMVLRLPSSELDTFVKGDPYTAINSVKRMAHYLSTINEELVMLLDEMKQLSQTEHINREYIESIVDKFDSLVDPNPILDEFDRYVPATVRAVSKSITEISKTKTTAPKEEPIPEFFKQPKFPDCYLKGHMGYPGITHPEYRKYLIEHEFVCPHCGKHFNSTKILLSQLVPIRNEEEEHRYDLRVTYRGFETEWYEIITCPHCYFSSFDTFFDNRRSIYKSRCTQKLEEFKNSITLNFRRERDLDFVFAQHYMAIICAPAFQDSRQIIARVWMNLVRLYQDAGEKELAKLAEEKTVQAYDVVYKECDLEPGQEQRLCLTLAGMLYARGEKMAAREWATKVRMAMKERTAYWTMAEQMIQDIRAEMD